MTVLTRSKVLKMPKILQSLMYLLGFERTEITKPNSQLFFWKIAKQYVCERMPTAMSEYKVLGQKPGKFPSYQTINYCEKIITGIEQEAVDSHNPTFGKLFKWLKLAIDTRKSDITLRLANAKKFRDERGKRHEEAEKRKADKEQFL
jgi:hypothetical protein